VKLLLSLIALSFLLNSCANRDLDIDIDIPAAQFSLSPENIGEAGSFEFLARGFLTHDLELGGSNQEKSIFSSSPSTIVIEKDNPTLNPGISFGGGAGLSVVKYVDIIGGKNLQGVYEIGTKVCLFYHCLSDKKGFKAAVYGLIGYDDEDETSNDNFFSEDDDKDEFENVSAFVKQNSRTAGLILGHRFDETSIIMLNFSYSHYRIRSTIKIENGESFDLGGRVENVAAVLGYRVSQKPTNQNYAFFYQVDIGQGRAKFWGTKYRNDPQLALSMTWGIRTF
jgi:hypothetical protein